MRKLSRAPEPFKGLRPNFMTPKILGYYKLQNGTYAELSEGTGISHQPIWGVTVRPIIDKDTSQMFHKLTDAFNFIYHQAEQEEKSNV